MRGGAYRLWVTLLPRKLESDFVQGLRRVLQKRARCGGVSIGWGILLGVPAIFVLSYFYLSIPVLSNIGLCAVRRFIGFPCPGCGLTTAFIKFSHGDFLGGMNSHPLAIVVAIWLFYNWIRSVVAVAIGRWPTPLMSQSQRDWFLTAFLVGLFLQWGLRSLL